MLEDFARRTPTQRDLRQYAGIDEDVTAFRPCRDRHVTGSRDREQRRIDDRRAGRARIVEANRVYPLRLTVPYRTVDDTLSVWREAGVANLAPAECQPRIARKFFRSRTWSRGSAAEKADDPRRDECSAGSGPRPDLARRWRLDK